MLVNHETKHLWFHNPKTGGMALSTYLLTQGYIPIHDPHQYSHIDRTAYRHAWIVPPEYSHYTKWFVIRDPIMRIRSLYRYSLHHNLVSNECPFSTFISEEHWKLMPQSVYLNQCSSFPNYVIHYTDLPILFPALLPPEMQINNTPDIPYPSIDDYTLRLISTKLCHELTLYHNWLKDSPR